MQVEKDFLKVKEHEGLSLTKEELSYDDIQTIIDVSRPYHALENEGAVKIGDKTIGFVADFSQEMPFPYEDGQLGFSETARHMAIAGSVAAALRNPNESKHYYLALNGLMRHDDDEKVLPSSIVDGIDEIIPFAGKPRVFAYSTDFNKRESTSEIFLFTGDKHDHVVRMNVSYKIIPAKLFSRFFPEVEGIDKSLLGPWTQEKSNPYTEAIDISISDERSLTTTASSTMPRSLLSVPPSVMGTLIPYLASQLRSSLVILWRQGCNLSTFYARKTDLLTNHLLQRKVS